MSDTEREESADTDRDEPAEADRAVDEEPLEESGVADGSDVDADTNADGNAESDVDASTDARSETDAEEAETDAEGSASDVDEATIAEQVAERDPEDVAEEIADLRRRNAELELEVEDLESRLKRKQAEFQNYKKRQKKRQQQERERATEDLVERLLEVRDNLKRAIEQDEDADIREGVEATFRLLDDVLEGENVDPIEPEAGTEVDPQRHEVLLRVESDQPEGTVAEVHRPGYEMAGKVLRAAQVTVAEDGE